MRVLLLTQWFDPEPTFKGLAFARELVRQGCEVDVLTGFPNYPGGRIYPGYSVRLFQYNVIDGVHITRVPLYPSHDQSHLRRFFNYLTFSISAAIYGAFIIRKPSVIYSYHPPITVGLAALFIKAVRRVPVLYDLQDLWPDTLRATGMLTSSFLNRLIAHVCLCVYRHVDHIVVLSPGFKRVLLSRGVPQQKISIIYNWCDEASLARKSGSLPSLFNSAVNRYVILFAGNIGKAQALSSILDAACILKSLNSRVTWVFLGHGVERQLLLSKAANLNLDNVVFLPPVPMTDVGIYLHHADALLVHLRKDPLFKITIPSKTQAYMAVGKPILMAVEGDAADLVRSSSSGIVVEPENAVELAKAAEFLSALPQCTLDSMGRSAKSFYSEHLSIHEGVRQFITILTRLC
jgi:colanic acid biosynthesis glycosyl transferase WcaI